MVTPRPAWPPCPLCSYCRPPPCAAGPTAWWGRCWAARCWGSRPWRSTNWRRCCRWGVCDVRSWGCWGGSEGETTARLCSWLGSRVAQAAKADGKGLLMLHRALLERTGVNTPFYTTSRSMAWRLCSLQARQLRALLGYVASCSGVDNKQGCLPARPHHRAGRAGLRLPRRPAASRHQPGTQAAAAAGRTSRDESSRGNSSSNSGRSGRSRCKFRGGAGRRRCPAAQRQRRRFRTAGHNWRPQQGASCWLCIRCWRWFRCGGCRRERLAGGEGAGPQHR